MCFTSLERSSSNRDKIWPRKIILWIFSTTIEIAIASCNCDVEIPPRFPTNIININLILNFSFQKFLYIIIIKLICSNTNDTYLINTKDKILWIWLYKFVYKRVKRFRFFLLISLSYLYVESQCVSRVTCLSLDYNFESSILFALFPDFPTSLPHCAHHLRIHAQTESNHTPFYPACRYTRLHLKHYIRIYTSHILQKWICVALQTLVNYPIAKYGMTGYEENKIWRRRKNTTFPTHKKKFILHRYNATSISRNSIKTIPSIKGWKFQISSNSFPRRSIQLGQFRLYYITSFWDITISPTRNDYHFEGEMISYEILDEKLAKLRILRWPCRENCIEADKNQRPTNARFVTSVFSLHARSE